MTNSATSAPPPAPIPAPTGPLAGMRILDLTTVLLGPYATKILGDLGADIIKIETVEGEGRRDSGPMVNKSMGQTFMVLNRAKRAIAINLKDPAGREAFLRLAATADAMVHNARVQAMKRLRLDYEHVRKVKPDIAYCYAVGFGSKGRYAGRPAYDDIIQGLSSLPSLLNTTTGKTTFVPINFADRVTGIHLANATLAALLHRARTGEGQEVEVPMFETMAEMVLSEHLWSDYFVPPRKVKNRNRMFDRRPYKTKDGYICVMASGEKMFSAFCDIIDRPELKTDPRFAHRSQRTNHLPEVYEITEAALATRTSAEWVEVLNIAGIPCGPIYDVQQVFEDEQVQHLGLTATVTHPALGELRIQRHPVTLSRTPASVRSAAPDLGVHNDEVLGELGYSAAEIERLRADAVI